MKEQLPVSKELLNAFVDDELDSEERQEVIAAQVDGPGVAEEICELRVLKDIVHGARYDTGTTDYRVEIPGNHYYWNRYVTKWFAVASLAIIVMTLAVTGMQYQQNGSPVAQQASQSYSDIAALLDAHPVNKDIKVVVHITREDRNAATQLFSQLDQVLEDINQYNRHVRVEVIASGPGLSVLRKGKSPYPDKIQYINTHYDTIEFVACQRSLLRQAKVQNTEVSILPQALITHSGPELIKRRQRQGWSYIAI